MDPKETPAGINGPKNDQVSNNISSQKVMAAQPTISPAKELLQLNQQYLQPKSYCSSTNNISSQKVIAAQPTISPAKKQGYQWPQKWSGVQLFFEKGTEGVCHLAKMFWQLNQQYIQPKKLWQLNQQYLQPKIFGKWTNNISSQKVMAAKPTISPAKILWQINQQYLQPKRSGS